MALPDVRIPPIYREDYEVHWGKIDYKGKRVLDTGASNGDTADFFLRHGAKDVVAVEGDDKLYPLLESNAKKITEIIPISMWIENKEQWQELINIWKPDVIKSDCEGCEATLFLIENNVWCLVPEYIIEVHGKEIRELMLKKCLENNYEIVNINAWAKDAATIIYARKK